jgi:30S ribosomal protein S31
MGKGDKKSKRGKIWRGSYGKSRPKKSHTATGVKKEEEKKDA